VGRKKPVPLGGFKGRWKDAEEGKMGRNVSKEYVPVYSLSVVSLIPYGTR